MKPIAKIKWQDSTKGEAYGEWVYQLDEKKREIETMNNKKMIVIVEATTVELDLSKNWLVTDIRDDGTGV